MDLRMLGLCIKGIVPKMKIWCLPAYPKGIQDVGDIVSSVEHKQRCAIKQEEEERRRRRRRRRRRDEDEDEDEDEEDDEEDDDDDDVSCAGCCVNALRTVGPGGGSEVKNDINTVQLLAQTDRFVSKDLNVSTWAKGFNLVLSVNVFFLSMPWVPLTDIIWLTDCNSLSYQTSNLYKHQISIFGVNYPFKGHRKQPFKICF